ALQISGGFRSVGGKPPKKKGDPLGAALFLISMDCLHWPSIGPLSVLAEGVPRRRLPGMTAAGTEEPTFAGTTGLVSLGVITFSRSSGSLRSSPFTPTNWFTIAPNAGSGLRT